MEGRGVSHQRRDLHVSSSSVGASYCSADTNGNKPAPGFFLSSQQGNSCLTGFCTSLPVRCHFCGNASQPSASAPLGFPCLTQGC